MCESIYLGKTQQTLKKIMDGHFSNLLSLLKNGQNSDSFAAHFGYNFNSTTSCTDLTKQMNQVKVSKSAKPDKCNDFFYET